jgi:hypothetical protein
VAKARGGDADLLRLFKNLGVSAEEVKNLGIDDLFVRVARAVGRASDSATGNAYSTALMGKSAREVAPLLRDLADRGLSAARVTSRLAEEGAHAREMFNGLAARFDDIKVATGTELTSRINALALAFKETSDTSTTLAESLQKVYRAAVYGGDSAEAQKRLRDTGAELARLQDELKKLDDPAAPRTSGAEFLVDRVRARLEGQIKSLEAQRTRAEQDVERLNGQQKSRDAVNLPPIPDSAALAAIKAAAEKAAAERRRMIELGDQETVRYVDELKRQFDEVVYSWDESGSMRIEIDRGVYAEQIANAQRAADGLLRIQREQNAKIAAEVEAGLDGSTATEIVRDQVKAQMSEIEEATRRNAQLAQELGLTFASAFEDAVAGGKGLSDILKGIERDIAKIIARKAVTEPIIGAFDTVFGSGKGAGASGFQGIVESGLGFLKGLFPSFDVGTPYVPRTGLALIHQGERIIPAAQNRAGVGGGPVFNVDMRGASADAVADLRRLVLQVNGTLESRAVAAVGAARSRGSDV